MLPLVTDQRLVRLESINYEDEDTTDECKPSPLIPLPFRMGEGNPADHKCRNGLSPPPSLHVMEKGSKTD